MKKFFLALTSAAVLAATMAFAPEPAVARHLHDQPSHHVRHHKVCRVIWKKRIVWRHHRPHVVRYKVRRCWYRR